MGFKSIIDYINLVAFKQVLIAHGISKQAQRSVYTSTNGIAEGLQRHQPLKQWIEQVDETPEFLLHDLKGCKILKLNKPSF